MFKDVSSEEENIILARQKVSCITLPSLFHSFKFWKGLLEWKGFASLYKTLLFCLMHTGTMNTLTTEIKLFSDSVFDLVSFLFFFLFDMQSDMRMRYEKSTISNFNEKSIAMNWLW